MINKFEDSEYIAENTRKRKCVEKKEVVESLCIQCAVIVSMFIESLHKIKKLRKQILLT